MCQPVVYNSAFRGEWTTAKKFAVKKPLRPHPMARLDRLSGAFDCSWVNTKRCRKGVASDSRFRHGGRCHFPNLGKIVGEDRSIVTERVPEHLELLRIIRALNSLPALSQCVACSERARQIECLLAAQSVETRRKTLRHGKSKLLDQRMSGASRLGGLTKLRVGFIREYLLDCLANHVNRSDLGLNSHKNQIPLSSSRRLLSEDSSKRNARCHGTVRIRNNAKNDRGHAQEYGGKYSHEGHGYRPSVPPHDAVSYTQLHAWADAAPTHCHKAPIQKIEQIKINQNHVTAPLRIDRHSATPIGPSEEPPG